MEKKLLDFKKLLRKHSKTSFVLSKSQKAEREKVRLLLSSDRERQRATIKENRSLISHLYKTSPSPKLITSRQSINASLSSFLLMKKKLRSQSFESLDSKISNYSQALNTGAGDLVKLVALECSDKAKFLNEILELAEEIKELHVKKLSKEICSYKERSMQEFAHLKCSQSKELAKYQIKLSKIRTERDEANDLLNQHKMIFERNSRNYKHHATRPNQTFSNESSQIFNSLGFDLLSSFKVSPDDEDIDILTQTITDKNQILHKIKENVRSSKLVLKELQGQITEASRELELLKLEIEVKQIEYKSYKPCS